jgi:hypothetical protein
LSWHHAIITAAAAHGARGIDFYHYGLVSGDALQRVREWAGPRV